MFNNDSEGSITKLSINISSDMSKADCQPNQSHALVSALFVGCVSVKGGTAYDAVCIGTNRRWVQTVLDEWIIKKSSADWILIGEVKTVFNINIDTSILVNTMIQ